MSSGSDVSLPARQAAARIVDVLAERLADPGHVATVAQAPGNEVESPSGRYPVWNPVELGDGHPAVSLLFSELGADDPEQRKRVHAYLSAAKAGGLAFGRPRLYVGLTAFAYAGHIAAGSFGGYATLLAEVDAHIAAGAIRQAYADAERLRTKGAIGTPDSYDVINGAAGVGRYLLGRYELTGDQGIRTALTDVLEMLVALALGGEVLVAGTRLPAWWVEVDTEPAGCIDLGVAHGIAGPLALLASAWRAGVRVERHDEAAERIVRVLSRCRGEDGTGPYWPRWVTPDVYAGRAPLPGRGRDAWCYGSAGAGRAVFLAGRAFGRPEWCAGADAALRGALSPKPGDEMIPDVTLCHGWAGLLQIASRMAADTGDAWYRDAAGRLAAEIVDRFDAEAPFGYRARQLGDRPLDRPGLVEGATGIALALHAYARSEPPSSGWDAAFLLI